jgi:hypothetical protein
MRGAREMNMSDEATTTEAAVVEGGNSGFTPPATQDELNAILAERIKRERAKYADYTDLKTKAAQFDELTESQKTEIQKATERAEAAERALNETRSEAQRFSVLARHQIPDEYQDLVQGSDAEALEASALKVRALIQATAPKERASFVIPDEGGSPQLALNGDGIESALKKALGISS